MVGVKIWKHYTSMKINSKPEAETVPRLSLTADIVGYRRCPRQYGYFVERGFVPAHTVQLYYGTIVHQVLDRAHHHYQGFDDPKTKDTIPSDQDIDRYFTEVENSLKAHGIKAINKNLRTQALEVTKQFNKIEGPSLYPLVVDTEHRVRGSRQGYMMEGVVDVLVAPGGDRNKPSQWEIWDYKGQKRPANGTDLESYTYQMQVYAALYNIRNGCYPKSAKLYFLNELKDATISRPPNAILEVEISETKIDEALKDFDRIASEIVESGDKRRWHAPTPKEAREMEDTCTICDIRWSCPAWKSDPFPMPLP